MITQKKLKEVLDYNPESGVFTWARDKVRARKGCVTGSKGTEGYLRTQIDGEMYYCHRLVWLHTHGEWPDQIDHINGNRADNRIDNLRVANQQENMRNTRRSRRNTSGACGVHWQKRENKWTAYITVNSKKLHLGYFNSFLDACFARKSANSLYGFHVNHGRP